MRFIQGVTLAAALLGAVACKKNDGTAATGSGSTASASGSGPASPPSAPAEPPGTGSAPAGSAVASAPSPPGSGALTPKALDDALTAQGIAATSVETRSATPRSQWAAVKTKIKPSTAAVVTYTIWRVTSEGASMLELVPPPSQASSWFDELPAIDVKDIDGDGVDDAVIRAMWSRRHTSKSKEGELTTIEHVEAIYVVGGAKLVIGAQHASKYTTETNLEPGENAQPEESIAFTYAIKSGTPPVLHVEVGASEISPKRLKGLLDPKRDAWLTAADLPIVFK